MTRNYPECIFLLIFTNKVAWVATLTWYANQSLKVTNDLSINKDFDQFKFSCTFVNKVGLQLVLLATNQDKSSNQGRPPSSVTIISLRS